MKSTKKAPASPQLGGGASNNVQATGSNMSITLGTAAGGTLLTEQSNDAAKDIEMGGVGD